MKHSDNRLLIARVVAWSVILYGLNTIGSSLLRQIHLHETVDVDGLFVAVPIITGLAYVYLGSLLLHEKYNAWISAVAVSVFLLGFNLLELCTRHGLHSMHNAVQIGLTTALLACLLLTKGVFKVRSDARSFTQALRVSVVILAATFVYGVSGFLLLDRHDFHQEIPVGTAVHQTVDQFGLTTDVLEPHTRRARLFENSLSIVSVAAAGYVVVSFFQPLRMRLTRQDLQREYAEKLLERYPSEIDDFFKLWPHDKLYFFDTTDTAGLAYHVTRGVALVAGNPFGNPKRFPSLLNAFFELCFVNDWVPTFVHVNNKHKTLYKKVGLHLQKIGEEAVLNLPSFQAEQTGKSGKYFRQIRNRFSKLGYNVEVLQPPHSQAVLNRLREISDQWLEKPGRAERSFLLGYHDNDYFQRGPLALVTDEAKQIQGFINLVPTFEPGVANYDLLRCSKNAPGNCNDFLLLGLIDHLLAASYHTLNLGLSPLAGLDDAPTEKENSIIDTALRFLYSNGDRLYSFSGLHRFKGKYNPEWQDRYVAYRGGVRTFTRIVAALNRAMKVK